MTSRPILFSPVMVQAILADRKTQTRRMVDRALVDDLIDNGANILHRSPYGQPGDRLWVRESGWQRPERTPKMMRDGADTWAPYYYDADIILLNDDREQFKAWGFKRRPSIHMPRWACRLELEITALRVERLDDITEADTMAEGVTPIEGLAYPHLAAFRNLWDQINGKRCPWHSNPWVWVVSFKQVEAS